MPRSIKGISRRGILLAAPALLLPRKASAWRSGKQANGLTLVITHNATGTGMRASPGAAFPSPGTPDAASNAFFDMCDSVQALFQGKFCSNTTTIATVQIDYARLYLDATNFVAVTMGATSAATGTFAASGGITYSQARTAVIARAVSAAAITAAGNLAASNPNPGGDNFILNRAHARQLGFSVSTSGPDGFVGISAGFVGIGSGAHEVREVLGGLRGAGDITLGQGLAAFYLLDMWTYTAAATPNPLGNSTDYMSNNNGTTNFGNWSTAANVSGNNDDPGDWDRSTGPANDCCIAATGNAALPLGTACKQSLDWMGWQWNQT